MRKQCPLWHLLSSCLLLYKNIGDVRPFAPLHPEVLAIFQCGGSICHGKISEIACVEPEPVELHFGESQPKLLNGEWHKGGTFQNSTSFHLQIVHVDMPLWAKIHKRTPCSQKSKSVMCQRLSTFSLYVESCCCFFATCTGQWHSLLYPKTLKLASDRIGFSNARERHWHINLWRVAENKKSANAN